MSREMEQWKPVVGYEGLYEVSDWGNIKSLNYNHTGKEHIMKSANNHGYRRIGLSNNGNTKIYTVHRLVWEAFNGEIPVGLQINHLNEKTDDNRLINLKLVTQKENNNYGTRNERAAKALRGRKRPDVVINQSKKVEAYDDNGNVVLTFPSTQEAMRNGFSQSHVAACCRGKRNYHRGLHWRYVQ